MALSARIRTVVAVSVSLSMAALIHGMTLPLLSLILERHGVDEADRKSVV